MIDGTDRRRQKDRRKSGRIKENIQTAIGVVTLIAAILALGAAVGLRWGPQEDHKAMLAVHTRDSLNYVAAHARDSTQTAALTSLVTEFIQRTTTLEENQRFTHYMLCMQFRRWDPAAVPPGCEAVGIKAKP